MRLADTWVNDLQDHRGRIHYIRWQKTGCDTTGFLFALKPVVSPTKLELSTAIKVCDIINQTRLHALRWCITAMYSNLLSAWIVRDIQNILQHWLSLCYWQLGQVLTVSPHPDWSQYLGLNGSFFLDDKSRYITSLWIFRSQSEFANSGVRMFSLLFCPRITQAAVNYRPVAPFPSWNPKNFLFSEFRN